jgi:hypothetical protein
MPTPRKSSELHKLQNTKSQAREAVPEDDSKQFTGGRLKIPPEIKQDPKKFAVWKMLFSPLHRRRTLTKADSAAARLLVEQWVLWEVVNTEAQRAPFSEVVRSDKNGIEHSITVESAASKMAAVLHRGLMQALKEFSATPASREKTKATKTPPAKNDPFPEGSAGWIAEQLAIAKASQQVPQPAPIETPAPAAPPVTEEPPTDWDALLNSVGESKPTVHEITISAEGEALLREADQAFAEETL